MMSALWILLAGLALCELAFEHRADWRPRWYDVMRTALLFGLGTVASMVATVAVAVGLYSWAGWQNPLPVWVQFGGGFVLAEYAWYWWHRWSHAGGWRWHAWHHVGTRINLWMTHIGHPVFNGFAAVVRLVPLLLVGIDPGVVTAVGVVQMVWTMTAHLNIPLRTRWLNPWVVTPAVHRWHHAIGARVNFGLCLTVFDRLHGTYRVPVHDPVRVGASADLPGEDAILAHLRHPLM